MYISSIPTIPEKLPWVDVSFDKRLAMMTRGSPRAAYYYSSPDTSTFRYRAYNMCQALAAVNGRNRPAASWFSDEDLDFMTHVLDACDVLVLCRNSLYNDQIARIASQARARNRKILFDVDDLVFDPAYVHLIMHTLGVDTHVAKNWDFWHGYVGRVGATYSLCDGALVTNSVLARQAEAWSHKPARIIPNFLNREQQETSDRVWSLKEESGWRRDNRIHLGYFSGSPSHNQDFRLIASAIARVMDEDSSIWLRVVGFLDAVPELARHSQRVELLPLADFVNLQGLIGSVEMNLVPLQDNTFTNCKSDLKWFEAAVVGALTIASPIHAYRDVVKDGHNGWLARPHEWSNILRYVCRHIGDLGGVVRNARAEARERYGWDRQASNIEAALFGEW